jgi:hypothetical protein
MGGKPKLPTNLNPNAQGNSRDTKDSNEPDQRTEVPKFEKRAHAWFTLCYVEEDNPNEKTCTYLNAEETNEFKI